MNTGTAHIPLDSLRQFTEMIFEAIGVPADDKGICADVLVEADRRGIDSHGVGRLKPIYYDRIVHERIQQPVTNIEVVRDVKATAVLDGHHGMGMVIAHRAMDMAIEKARDHGLGMVAVRNSTHYGFAAYYPMMACAADMIGITGTNARPSVAPTFGVENMLGTNPLVFAMPTDEPFAFTNDYATSVLQRGRIEQYAREGRSCPPGLVINQEGETLTDPQRILDALVKGHAALTPIGGIGEDTGGYKGYGFATVVEILSAALQQGAFLKALTGMEKGEKKPYCLGHFFIAIDIAAFTEPDSFRKTTGDILRELRESKLADGAERIYTCGQKEYLAAQERDVKGVPIPLSLQKELVAMRDEQDLSWTFPFED